jgi:sulfane dehydrogenase subunit SoxC
MTRSIPVGKGWDDAMIAYAQNGEALRPEQGYPVRLFLPGWEGNTNVKWLRRLELSDQPFMTREETSKYTEQIKDGKIRQFSFDMDDVPSSLFRLTLCRYKRAGSKYGDLHGVAGEKL